MQLNAIEGTYSVTAALHGHQEFAIPKARLVGFGRAQAIQYVCPCCKDGFFPGNPLEPRCSACARGRKKLPVTVERSPLFFVDVVGWDQRLSATQKRSHMNHSKAMVRDEYTCQYCGYSPTYSRDFTPLHVDHINPHCTGGSNRLDNLVVACGRCNMIAGNRVFAGFEQKREFILSARVVQGLPTSANEWREKGRLIVDEIVQS